jgi:hypothetical protein
MALTDAGRHAEALKDWGRAIQLAEETNRPGLRVQRALTLARLGRHRQARGEVDALARSPAAPGALLYQGARVYALSAAAAPQEADGAERAQPYARQAVALLLRSRQAGYLKGAAAIEALQTNPDFQSLRPRADYRRLLDSLEKKEGRRAGATLTPS